MNGRARSRLCFMSSMCKNSTKSKIYHEQLHESTCTRDCASSCGGRGSAQPWQVRDPWSAFNSCLAYWAFADRQHVISLIGQSDIVVVSSSINFQRIESFSLVVYGLLVLVFFFVPVRKHLDYSIQIPIAKDSSHFRTLRFVCTNGIRRNCQYSPTMSCFMLYVQGHRCVITAVTPARVYCCCFAATAPAAARCWWCSVSVLLHTRYYFCCSCCSCCSFDAVILQEFRGTTTEYKGNISCVAPFPTACCRLVDLY